MFNKPVDSTPGHNGKTPTGSSALATVEGVLTGATHEFHNFLDDVENLLKETSELTGEEFNQARARINQRIAVARKSVAKMGGSISEQTRRSIAAGNTYVHNEPWQAIGAGAVLGLLIGLIVARR